MSIYSEIPPTSSRGATSTNHHQAALRGIEGGWSADDWIDKAGAQVRENPTSLPLWFFRAVRHIQNRRLTYVDAFNTLHEAAQLAGTSDSEIRRAWFHALGNARMFRDEPPALRLLERDA